MSGDRVSGVVKFFNEKKGYGFIKRDDGDADVFFHFSALPTAVEEVFEGDKVSFTVEPGQKGKGSRAANITCD